MSKPKLILIGGGGHCRSCIDVIESEDKFTIEGIIDHVSKAGQEVMGYSIIGSDKDLVDLSGSYKYFFITIGQVKSSNTRSTIYNKLKSLGLNLPTIVSPKSYVSKHAKVGEGTIIMHHALVNAGSTIGHNCIINTKSLIEHDSSVGNHCHVSTGAQVNGSCVLGNNVFIGSGAVLNQCVTISDDCVVGSGSGVISNIDKKGSIWYGTPAKMQS